MLPRGSGAELGIGSFPPPSPPIEIMPITLDETILVNIWVLGVESQSPFGFLLQITKNVVNLL
jgi:hypothetical protein